MGAGEWVQELQPERLRQMDAAQYKAYHESQMRDNPGCGALHTLAAVSFTALGCACVAGAGGGRGAGRAAREYALLAAPLVLGHTLLAERVLLLDALFLLGAAARMARGGRLSRERLRSAFSPPNSFSRSRLEAVTNVRGLVHLITSLCILAVDFAAFPRYLAKTERRGYSPMDAGVGLFAIASGLVHGRAESGSSILPRHTYKGLAVLVFLGLSRCVLVSEFNYQEHVTEYGTHWNFFFTMATAKLLSTFLLRLTYSHRSILLFVATAVLHEALLKLGLERWVMSESPRADLVSANREGLSSCFGYVSMYLFGVFIKEIITDKTLKRYQVLCKLFLILCSLSVASFFLNLINPASRVLANAGYCTFIESILTLFILFFYTVEVIFHESSMSTVPLIIECINNVGLLYFLAANILTGLVNFTFRTFSLGNWETMIILNAYMLILLSFAILLNKYKIKLS